MDVTSAKGAAAALHTPSRRDELITSPRTSCEHDLNISVDESGDDSDKDEGLGRYDGTDED